MARSRESERTRGYDRNAIARSLGFRNEYEMRIRGGLAAARRGEITPETPRPEGRELARARGHAGARDLLRSINAGDEIRVAVNLSKIETNDAGDYVSIPLVVTDDDGNETEWWLTDISQDDLDLLIDYLEDEGAEFDENYDLRALGG